MQKSNLIADIHKSLATDIASMNELIASAAIAREELVELVSKYLINSGGKRIRPILTILSAKMFGYKGENHIKLATAVEFIHTATLLHDDVVDESSMRRFKPTANMIWGSKASILVGDFLFSQSFKLMVSTHSLPAMKTLSHASSVIVEGEVSQLVKLQEKRMITRAEYQCVINAKTAELFAAASQVGAIISGCSESESNYIREFGIVFGCIFQIIDDLLDYFGDVKSIGKNIGDDFFEGKVTLPLILLYEKLEEEEKQSLIDTIKLEIRSEDDFITMKNLLNKHNIKQQIFEDVKILAIEAKSLLYKINIENQYKNYLIDLVDFTTKDI